MALTRKALSAMGIEEDKIDQIILMHSETVNGLKEEIDKYKADALKVPELQKELGKIQKDADSKIGFEEKYNEIIEERKKLQEEFDKYRKDTENAQARASKEAAFKIVLKDAGIPEKHFAKIMKYSDIDALELDDKGEITTAKDLLKDLKEEWGDHVQKETEQGANTATPPTTTGAPSIGLAGELEKRYHENLYGITKEG